MISTPSGRHILKRSPKQTLGKHGYRLGERWEDELVVVLPDVVNEKPWHETASGIEAKGKELGLEPSQFDHWQAFKVAVMQKSLKAA